MHVLRVCLLLFISSQALSQKYEYNVINRMGQELKMTGAVMISDSAASITTIGSHKKATN